MKPPTLLAVTALWLAPLAGLNAADASRSAAKPNIVYIMADELGYYEPGFMGGKTIQTPNLDRLAAEGIRFHNLFAGSSVCAPTRCCFLTGKHSGHTSVRVNGGGTPLRAEEVTIACIAPVANICGTSVTWVCTPVAPSSSARREVSGL